jgi:hypothetical protein
MALGLANIEDIKYIKFLRDGIAHTHNLKSKSAWCFVHPPVDNA